MYSIRIKSLEQYNAPFPAADDQNAIAGVCQAIKRGMIDGQVLKIEDLSLFRMAAFDGKEGITKNRPKLVTDLAAIPGIMDFLKEVLNDVRDSI